MLAVAHETVCGGEMIEVKSTAYGHKVETGAPGSSGYFITVEYEQWSDTTHIRLARPDDGTLTPDEARGLAAALVAAANFADNANEDAG